MTTDRLIETDLPDPIENWNSYHQDQRMRKRYPLNELLLSERNPLKKRKLAIKKN
jgi:hypothetical protein